MINELLLQKLIAGQCSREELKYLQQYWEKGLYPEIDELLEQHWRAQELDQSMLDDDGLQERMWQNIRQQTTPVKAPRFSRRAIWTSAAAAAILLLITIGWWYSTLKTAETPQWVVAVNTGKGVKTIHLPDGTIVDLAGGSRFYYRTPFSEHERLTKLEGEAFFEVEKDPDRPFEVIANELKTKVIGTKFNLKALPNAVDVSVALLEGAVQIAPVHSKKDTFLLLKPGDIVTYSEQYGAFTRSTFTDDAPYAWKNGILYFQKASVQEVAQKLQSWYGIPFQIAAGSQLSGRLVHRYDTNKLTLDEVLLGISTVMDYRFEKQRDGSILIMPKQ